MGTLSSVIQRTMLARYREYNVLNDDTYRLIFTMMPGLWLMKVMCSLCGVTVFAYYASRGCDPMAAGHITSYNQVKIRYNIGYLVWHVVIGQRSQISLLVFIHSHSYLVQQTARPFSVPLQKKPKLFIFYVDRWGHVKSGSTWCPRGTFGHHPKWRPR